nr:unnamed protein product [Callosobruchus chinensis]
MRLTGSASERNSCSIATASLIIFVILSCEGFCTRYENNRHAKSQCKPSSREINSLENPKDCCKASREENTFNSSKCHNPFTKCGGFRTYPIQSPICLFANTRQCLNGIKEKFFFLRIFDICFNQHTIHLRMNIFNGNLESIEASCFCNLHLLTEAFY